MNHIDLFSGIGGFAIAAKWVWNDEYENILFCDNNRFCQEVLKKNFGKDSLIYGDIREVTRERVIADTEGRDFQVDLLTGGFPCQPFSLAGKRRGTDDNRYLWPEMFRVIQDFKPRWVVAENVYGILNIKQGLVFRAVCADLENEGYEVQPFIIPACAVNAPHRRNRVWIVAYTQCRRCKQKREKGELGTIYKKQQNDTSSITKSNSSDAPDTKHIRQIQRVPEERTRQKEMSFKRGSWKRPWLEVATELCRVDDGLPAELDGFKLSKAGHRVERLKALGNAIVPQVAVEIFKAIKVSMERDILNKVV